MHDIKAVTTPAQTGLKLNKRNEDGFDGTIQRFLNFGTTYRSDIGGLLIPANLTCLAYTFPVSYASRFLSNTLLHIRSV